MVFCHCAKCGRNRCSSFENMKVLIFCVLSLKMHIHAPKITVLGGLDHQNGGQYERDPQKALPCAETHRLTYRSPKLGGRWGDFCCRYWKWARGRNYSYHDCHQCTDWFWATSPYVKNFFKKQRQNWSPSLLCYSERTNQFLIKCQNLWLQCFDTVGWASGRASGP